MSGWLPSISSRKFKRLRSVHKVIDLSVLLPSIHPDRLERVWQSVNLATDRPFEVVVVGPYDLPRNLPGNWKFQKDLGSPARCFNIALTFARGEYVTLASDDMTYFAGKIDPCLRDGVVSAKHYYGTDDLLSQLAPEHYRVNHYDQHRSPHIPDYYLLTNVCFMKTDYLKALGGLDCTFEHHGVAVVDLAVRIQNDGTRVELSETPVCYVEHTDTTDGDHGPVHFAVTETDEPLFKKIYSAPGNRTRLDINNWQNSPAKWERRFK